MLTTDGYCQNEFVSGFEPSQSSASHHIRYRNLSPLWWFKGSIPHKEAKLALPRGSNPLNHMQLHRIRYRNLCFKGSIRNIRNDPSIFQCQGSNPLMHKCNHVTFHLYGFKGSIPQHSIIFQCQGSNPKAHADRSRYSTRVRTLHCKLQRRKVNHLEASNEASM